MQLAEHFRTNQTDLMKLLRQCGVKYAVVRLPEDENEQMPVDFARVKRLCDVVSEAGFKIVAVERAPAMERVKQGLPGRDEEIDRFITLITTLGKLEIPLLAYHFMAGYGWLRTDFTAPGRGGALVTSFTESDAKSGVIALPGEVAAIQPVGDLTEEVLWENWEYFVRAVVPVAEETGVTLAVHPDDPPIPSIRGIARILRDPDRMVQALSIVPSAFHGLVFCQGTFGTMNSDLYDTIAHVGSHIKFIHFRNIRGAAARFVETFIDEGQIDPVRAMEAYLATGFDGPIRPDHVPTLFGESNELPAYGHLARLHAVGYIQGLLAACAGR